MLSVSDAFTAGVVVQQFFAVLSVLAHVKSNLPPTDVLYDHFVRRMFLSASYHFSFATLHQSRSLAVFYRCLLEFVAVRWRLEAMNLVNTTVRDERATLSTVRSSGILDSNNANSYTVILNNWLKDLPLYCMTIVSQRAPGRNHRLEIFRLLPKRGGEEKEF